MFTNYDQAAAMYERYQDELYEQMQEEADDSVPIKEMTNKELVTQMVAMWDAEIDNDEFIFQDMLYELKRRLS